MDAQLINFSWLVRLRWGAIGGQLAVILFVYEWMQIPLQLERVLGIVAAEVAINLGCAWWVRGAGSVSERVILVLMLCDVLLLTGLLYCTGGAFNPFSFLYLVDIALGAVVLRPAFTWTLVAASVVCCSLLFIDHPWLRADPLPLPMHVDHLRLHLEGMWVGFAVGATFIVYFVQRVTRALAAREAELAGVRAIAARQEQFASLATLAAGAAHELSTPLSTIAVVAKELERQLDRGPQGTQVIADVRLIREQVDRCRDVLAQMAADASQGVLEVPASVGVATLVQEAVDGLSEPERVRLSVEGPAREARLSVPHRALVQALRGVLKNALQASPAPADIHLRVCRSGEDWRFEVHDTGCGMPPSTLSHAGEPFFTTKQPGEGMGLGLFLTRVVLARLGGEVLLESTPGAGTTAVLRLPAAPADITAPTGAIAACG
jgi:two-component system sensor histidine kinase RegB